MTLKQSMRKLELRMKTLEHRLTRLERKNAGKKRVNTKYTPKKSVKRNPRNTSGVTGVCFQKARNKWLVSFRKTHQGSFDTFEEAVECRYRAEQATKNPDLYLNSTATMYLREQGII